MASKKDKKSKSIPSYFPGKAIQDAFDAPPPIHQSSLTPVQPVPQPQQKTEAPIAAIKRPVPVVPPSSGFSPFGVTQARSFANVDLSSSPTRLQSDKQLANLDKYFPGFVPPIITPRQYVNLNTMEYTPVYLPMRFAGVARVSSEHGLGTSSGLITEIKAEQQQQKVKAESFADRNEKLLRSRSEYYSQSMQLPSGKDYTFKPSIQKDIKYPPPQSSEYKRINSYAKLNKRKKEGKRQITMMSEDEESDIERICSEFKLAKPNNISHMSLDFTQNSIIKTNDSKIPEGVPDYMKNLHKPTIVPVQWEVRYEQGFDNEGIEARLQKRNLFGKEPPQQIVKQPEPKPVLRNRKK